MSRRKSFLVEVETATGAGWVTCIDSRSRNIVIAEDKARAVAELERLGRKPAANDRRTPRELWDDAKSRTAGARATRTE